MKILFGKKLGMTTVFDETGHASGVTAVEVWPATVLRLRTSDKDGYDAMQLGAGETRTGGKAHKGQGGGKSYAVIAEFPKTADDVAPGTTFGLEQLEAGEKVTVSANSKGKGFQGTVKRYNFSRGPKSHGSKNYRPPGSIGATDAARVWPGQQMPGRMGNRKITQKNLKVVAVHPEENVVLVDGSVPGPIGSTVTITSLATVEATS